MPVSYEDADPATLRRQLLFRQCESMQELHDWILTFLDIDFPDGIVDPDSNSSPMHFLWEVYDKARTGDDENFRRVVLYASRDSYKTLGVAVLEVLMVLHMNRDVAHMAAIEGQAMKAQEYTKKAFRQPYLRDFVEGDNERMTRIVRFYNRKLGHSLTRSEYTKLAGDQRTEYQEIVRAHDQYKESARYIKVVICTLRGANSDHVPFFVVDEIDVVANPAAYEEAKSIPTSYLGKLPITVLTSTRKSAIGYVQKEIDNQKKSGVQVRHFNIIDVTQRCPPERHKPHLPKLPLYRNPEDLYHVDEETYNQMPAQQQDKFIKDEGFAGCLTCKLFVGCRTRLATHQTSNSVLLKSIPETIGKFLDHSVEMAKAQLLCWKPSNVGMIYGRFDRSRHILSPAQAYYKVFGEDHPRAHDKKEPLTKAELMNLLKEREVEWLGGMDFGHTHNFAYVHGFRDGKRCFITHCVGGPGLDPGQQIEVCMPFRDYEPAIFPDTSQPEKYPMFRKAGFKMRKWNKGKGTVHGGIEVVRLKLTPPLGGEPELYFIHDADEDPGMDLLVNRLAEYHWKQDATGGPSNIPNDKDDDECDALRYLVMNKFTPKGGLAGDAVEESTGGLNATFEVHPMDQVGTNLADPDDWITQQIALLTGGEMPAPRQRQARDPMAGRPQMTIETPEGSSYYASENGDKPKGQSADPRKGKKGRLVWDI